jgi:hypothetical protein
MGEFSPSLVVAGGFAAILGGLAWRASRTRRRGVDREIMGPVDEIYRLHAHQVHVEFMLRSGWRERRVVPMPSPDDHWGRSRGKAGRPGV